MHKIITYALLILAVFLVSGCALVGHLVDRELPAMPGLPDEFGEMQDMLRDLGLPDLSDIGDLPGLDSLPFAESSASRVTYRGPIEQRIPPGDRIPGTDIVLTQISDKGAEFSIAGLRSERIIGDSLDFDGPWPGLPGVTYNLRLRIYRVGEGAVRAAGVHQLSVDQIQPNMESVDRAQHKLKFPFTVNVKPGDTIVGTTYGYDGPDDRGGRLTGLAGDEYPYRKVGDSIRWEGMIRPDIPAQYALRMLYYGDNNAQVGGIVTLFVPSP